MQRRRIAVITRETSDMLELLLRRDPSVIVMKPEEIKEADWEQIDAIAILGGTTEKPLLFKASERIHLEEQLLQGKRMFAEYVASIGHVYSEQPSSTRFQRLAFCAEDVQVRGLSAGMLIDDQCGMRIKPHAITCTHNTPILQYTGMDAHDRVELDEAFSKEIGDRALWFDHPDNLLVCSFRLCNFVKARYAPKQRIAGIVEFIMNWLFETKIELEIPFTYTTGVFDESRDLDTQVAECVDRAMGWMNDASVLSEEGKTGILEGYATEINPDGVQKLNTIRRADCIGEASLSYFLHYRLTGEDRSIAVSNSLLDFLFDYYVCRDAGELNGMMRWTDEAWGVCYQDDVARAIIPLMLRNLYTGSTERLDDVMTVLQFLVRTTGTDGTRVSRTDNKDLSPERLKRLRSEPGRLPSAHYNAYYYAALCLAFKLTGKEQFLQVARTGMDTILASYPATKREQSETQEYCRLILPLSWMYEVTGDSRYKEWLYRVTKDLQAYKHPSGCYLEWDSGYMAAMRSKAGEGESSLLVINGDPVVDLLYSNNWLPMAFIQAYFVTKDRYFFELWKENAAFMINAQLHSANPVLHGAWARAFDTELKEVYGSPADFGWGPWAIESGWTVAEIASGLAMGLLRDDLINAHEVG